MATAYWPVLVLCGVVSLPGVGIGLLLRRWANAGAWDRRDRWTGVLVAGAVGLFLFYLARDSIGVFSLWFFGILLAPLMAGLFELVGGRQLRPHVSLQQPSAIPEQAEGEPVLGMRIVGDLRDFVRGRFAVFPAAILRRGLLVVGFPGAGKTETLLRLAATVARVLGWQVVFLDCKGDRDTAARFYAVMKAAGMERIRLYPAESYDGWRGDAGAIKDRLKSVLDFSEPYYESIADLMLDLACNAPGGPPRSSQELLARLRLDELANRYHGDASAVADISEIEPKDARGVYNRYRAFFGKVRGQLDGTWAFEDTDATYFLIDGVALQDQAIGLGRYLLQDFSTYTARRKEHGRQVLFVVDEFSAIERGTRIHDLIERLRGYGAAVVVGSQSYGGLGEYADRILDATPTKIIHQCDDPERLTERAGQIGVLRRTREVQHDDAAPGLSGRMMVAEEKDARVDPDRVRQLAPGECFIVYGGRALQVRVERAQALEEDIREGLALVQAVPSGDGMRGTETGVSIPEEPVAPTPDEPISSF